MRNRNVRGYTGYTGTGYRGRRSNGKPWLILVLVLILLAATAFLIVQRYMVYDMDGSYHFEFPWFRRAGDGQQVTHRGTRQDLEIIIHRPDEPAEAQPMRARELDAPALAGGMSRALAELPEEINTVAIRLKTVDGDLLYPSALPAAIEAKAVAGSSIAESSLRELTASDFYTIARLAALHDSRFSFAHMTEAAIEQKAYKNYIWYAPDSSFYLAPEKELARQYLVSIAREVASLGFDELLFDEFGYPAAGRLNNIKTQGREMSQEDALALLADDLRKALRDTDTRLSLMMDENTVLSGANATTGQSLAVLAPRFDRIYVPTTEENIPALLSALEPYGAALVPILDSALAEGPYMLLDSLE